MHSRYFKFLSPLCLTLLLFLTVSSLHAATSFYWEGGTTNISGNGNGISLGGSGTWNNTTISWDQGSNLPYTNWPSLTNSQAIFAGTAGTVTI